MFHQDLCIYTAILITGPRRGKDRLIDLEIVEQTGCRCGLTLRHSRVRTPWNIGTCKSWSNEDTQEAREKRKHAEDELQVAKPASEVLIGNTQSSIEGSSLR